MKRHFTLETFTQGPDTSGLMSLTLDKDQEVYVRLQTELRDRAVSFSSVRMSKPELYDATFGVEKLTGLAEPRSLLGMTHFQRLLPFASSYTAAAD